jgi:hypothetical protein
MVYEMRFDDDVKQATLVLQPVRDANGLRSRQRFMVMLDGRLIVTSDVPLVDAARELIAKGYPHGLLLTARLDGSKRDLMPAQTVRALAALGYEKSLQAGGRDRPGFARLSKFSQEC